MTTLTLQNNKGANNSVELSGIHSSVINNRSYNANFTEEIIGKNNLMVRGEEFVLIGLNGASPSNRFNQQQTLRGNNEVIGYKAVKESKESDELKELTGTMMANAVLSLFPMGHLLEMFKHVGEMATKSTEENGQKVRFTMTTNIDPRDAINPNKSFLPKSPFYITPTPQLGLWDRVKKSADELESKKKKRKTKGLGKF